MNLSSLFVFLAFCLIAIQGGSHFRGASIISKARNAVSQSMAKVQSASARFNPFPIPPIKKRWE